MKALFLIVLPLAAELFDLEMTSKQKKKLGICRMTAKEKTAFQSWLDKNYEKREVPLEQEIPEKRPNVSQIEYTETATFVHLNDGTSWRIKPKDAPIAQGWINPEVGIIVHKSGDLEYPTRLTNTLSGSSVCATSN